MADLGEHDIEELIRLREQLIQSIKKRTESIVESGADVGHSARLAEEKTLLKSLEKHLKDRR